MPPYSLSLFLSITLSSPLTIASTTSSSHQPPSSTSTSEDGAVRRLGWVSEPNGRGSWDIMWSCVFTMFLCSWFVLCINVPDVKDSKGKIFRRKIYLTLLGLLGPEFIFQISLGQWHSARQNLKDFHALGQKNWTLRKAFFVEMGGLRLFSKDFPPFAINAKQLHYLVKNKYMKMPRINDAMIDDKNKVDSLLRVITVVQTVWFLVNLAGRSAQHLAITTLELTSAAFVVFSVATVLCWMRKPADITMPIDVALYEHTSMAQIIIDAGEKANGMYHLTPLDFISRKEWHWSKYWANWTSILRHAHYKTFAHQQRPVQRIHNSISYDLNWKVWIFIILGFVYCSIFLAGWNYSFPTQAEKNLWRAASSAQVASQIAYFSFTELALTYYPGLRKRLTSPSLDEETAVATPYSRQNRRHHRNRIRRKLSEIAAGTRNNSVSKDPELYVPLKALVPIYVTAFFYCNARTYIFIADFIELRSLPVSAYQSVNWWSFLPHY